MYQATNSNEKPGTHCGTKDMKHSQLESSSDEILTERESRTTENNRTAPRVVRN